MLNELMISSNELHRKCSQVNEATPLTRICGSYDIYKLKKLSTTMIDSLIHLHGQYIGYWRMCLMKKHTLELIVKEFSMLSTPECAIVFLEITKYPSSKIDDEVYDEYCDVPSIRKEGKLRKISSRYCGHLPQWKESTMAYQVHFKLEVGWDILPVSIKMDYYVSNPGMHTLYKRRYVQRNLHLGTMMHNRRRHTQNRLVLFLVTLHGSLMRLKMNMDSMLLFIWYDGPGPNAAPLTSSISSSHQTLITLSNNITVTKNLIFFTEIIAPSTLSNLHHTINSSTIHILYEWISLIANQSSSLSILITNIELRGFRGQKCEYGGAVLSSDVGQRVNYGPYCDQSNAESYLIVGLSLPVEYGNLLLYSYARYATLFITF